MENPNFQLPMLCRKVSDFYAHVSLLLLIAINNVAGHQVSIPHVLKERINIEPALSHRILLYFEVGDKTSWFLLRDLNQKYLIDRATWWMCFCFAFGVYSKVEAATDGFLHGFDWEGLDEDVDVASDFGDGFWWFFLILHLKC